MSKLQRVGLVGCGNVGSALVMELAAGAVADKTIVASRDISHAEAAILDAGSVFPKAATAMKATNALEGIFDVVVITAGLQPHGNISQSELLEENLKIVVQSLKAVETSKIVIIGTPVD